VTTAAIVERVREAYSERRTLRVSGAGTWLVAGRPVQAVDTLSLADDHGIVEYVPGDLTLTARAGTRLAEIVATTGAQGQWLPLDPWGGDNGTLGGTLSTATAGPHAFSQGLPRDVVLGAEFVTGTGQVIRAGGRVVKNVAGFDLTRLIVGSWGTLGVITEVTVRLRARPERTRTLAIAAATTHTALNELAARFRALPFTPLASEILNARLAAQLVLGDQATLLVRIGGNEKSLDGQLAALRAFGEARDVAEDIWDSLRSAEPAACVTWRWSQLPSVFGETWSAADRATRPLGGSLMHGNPARGVVRVILDSTPKVTPAELVRSAAAFRGTVVTERLPDNAWPLVDSRAANDSLARAIREKFDPARILNPGILGADA
jgi:glycolate oxidase FAD binding subunit